MGRSLAFVFHQYGRVWDGLGRVWSGGLGWAGNGIEIVDRLDDGFDSVLRFVRGYMLNRFALRLGYE